MSALFSQFMFQNEACLLMLLGLPFLALLIGFSQRRRRYLRKLFLSEGDSSASIARGRYRELTLVCLIYFLAVLALARPSWSPRPKHRSQLVRDVVFVLDVSRSMLAEDVAPNRLSRAKSMIAECLQRLNGERAGLVIVAGDAEVKCPLTVDYDCLRKILMACDERSVPKGGSMLAKGIGLADKEVLNEGRPGYSDLVLITDGGDQGSALEKEVAQLKSRGVRLLIVGIGSPSVGARIPISEADNQDLFLRYKGQPVLTRLNSDMLRDLVGETENGLYFEMGTGNMDLGKVYSKLAQNSSRIISKGGTRLVWKEGFQLFLGAALFFFALLALPSNIFRSLRLIPVFLLLALLILTPSSTSARPHNARSLFAQGVKAYEDGRYDSARDLFVQAQDSRPGLAELDYNLGLALYRSGQYGHAVDAFHSALNDAKSVDLRADCDYNLGNALFKRAVGQIGKDADLAQRLVAESISSYRRVIELKGGEDDATHNLEIAQQVNSALKEMRRKGNKSADNGTKSQDDQSGEGEKSAKPNGDEKSSDSKGKGKLYLMPTENPKDILEEERRNNEQRLERIERDVAPVDRDW